MDLRELLELMTQMAKVTQDRICLGIRVCEDGTGRTTPGSVPGETVDCPYGKSLLEWDNPTEGARQLEQELLHKFLSLCETRRSPAVSVGREGNLITEQE